MARAGYRDGALCGRLRDPVPQRRRSRAGAWRWCEQWTAEAGLTLHPEKTRIVDATQPGGFDFLGYHFERGYRMAADEEPGEAQGHDPREDHDAPTDRACRRSSTDVNRTLRGWFGYFKHSHRTTFRTTGRLDPDALRSILRKRQRQARPRSRVRIISAGPMPSLPSMGCSPCNSPCTGRTILYEVNHQLESRMREIRPSGSEGGGTGSTGPPYPYLFWQGSNRIFSASARVARPYLISILECIFGTFPGRSFPDAEIIR